MNPSRRNFLLAGGAAALLTAQRASSATTREQLIVVRTGEEIATIRPELHSHFAEHLGTCIYGGLWVGKNSSVPNDEGYNAAAIRYLKALGVPVLRWPGGCYADDYHWRDGIGPAEKRPKRVNFHWGRYVEDGSFGTREFIGLCRRIGAEPYFAGNVGSGSPEELRNWVEYCNYPSGSTLSDERAANGSPEPFHVKYWGVGNENWGCGGQMQPEEYAANYRRFSTYMGAYGNTKPFLVACGPNGNNREWTRRFFESMKGAGRLPDGYSMHYYSGSKSASTSFTAEAMREQLSSFARIETAVVEQRALMDVYDPNRRIGLMVDEWGVWDRIPRGIEQRYGRNFEPITMRSGIAAALGLNLFHRQADKLVMCNIAQIVNVLHAVLLIDGDHCVRTTTYYAFELLKPHRGGMALKADTGDDSPDGLSVSASRQAQSLIATFVNPKPDTTFNVDCTLDGARTFAATARILHDADWNATNDFDHPDRITPANYAVEASGSKLRLALPPLSIVTVTAALA